MAVESNVHSPGATDNATNAANATPQRAAWSMVSCENRI
jgi:hypothetical protein